MASFGQYPEWQKQLSKFGFVQDRLREWRPSVLDKIKHFSCMTIQMLDIDGFRIDKALTITSDAQAEWSDYIRSCARDLGKNNFYIPGEIVSGNTLAAIYLGRGKEPQMSLQTLEQAMAATNNTDDELYIRTANRSALDGAFFHYSVYRGLTRFLGIDGVYAAELDTPINWVDAWEMIAETNDMVNINTGQFDPRHMYGVSNQDVFRWPALTLGVERSLSGLFVTTMIMPGVPTLMWGEEQAFYVLENTASNYLFGRSPMTSQLAWQIHGCYSVGTAKYSNFPLDAALYGCYDDNLALDHRDPSHPVRNILKRMYELRTIYPVLNDGYMLQRLSNKTEDIYLPGSNGTATETGLYSVLRSQASVQDFKGQGQGNQSVWLVYGNANTSTSYTFDCSNSTDALIAPFDSGETVKNLFYPYEEYTLIDSPEAGGCLTQMDLSAFGYKAFVPKAKWIGSAPSITSFAPGHDYRMLSKVSPGESETLDFEIKFSLEMDCDSVTKAITIESNSDSSTIPTIDGNSVQCSKLGSAENGTYSGSLTSIWSYAATLKDVSNGVHAIVVTNASAASGNGSTNAVDRFLFRIGQADNPMVFPRAANYSTSLLHKDPNNGSYYISHKAAGATKYRYSVDWESSFSDWLDYTGENTTLMSKNWTGTSRQAWKGEHVYVQYWGSLSASSDHFQHGDLGNNDIPRRFPHLYIQGPFNQFSYDTGLPGTMEQMSNGSWYYDFMTEWPTSFQINEWGSNKDGRPDNTLILGDIDHDYILDRIPPNSLLINIINVTDVPPSPHTAWRIFIDDATYTYFYVPVGSRWAQLALYILLAIVPIMTAAAIIWIFIKSFYHVKFNELGISTKQAIIPLAVRRRFKKKLPMNEKMNISVMKISSPRMIGPGMDENALHAELGGARRRVLIATMEYDIEDWEIKIKIGGLGVMAQLMGKNLGHQDLIW